MLGVATRATNQQSPFDAGAKEEDQMQKLAFITGALAILSTPALAGPAAGDKPMVVAEEGVSVNVGDDHDRDRDHHRHVVIVHHHDEDRDHDHHHKVVVIHGHHDDDDHH